ncbi:MAG: DUF4920 domain-containing protein [Cyclobacteriaceae bacterium]
MRYLLVLALFAFVSCGQESGESKEKKDAEVETEKSEYESFGDKIDANGSVQASQFVNNFEGDSVNVKLQAKATAVCKKKGCWMNVDLGNDQTMKVTFKDYGFFVPKDIEEKNVIVQGVAKKQVTGVDELKHYAEDAGKSQEEIDAITEPKEEIVFVASGVLIEADSE